MSTDERVAALERDVRMLAHKRELQSVEERASMTALMVRVMALETAAIEQKKTGSMILKIVATAALGIVVQFVMSGGLASVAG